MFQIENDETFQKKWSESYPKSIWYTTCIKNEKKKGKDVT